MIVNYICVPYFITDYQKNNCTNSTIPGNRILLLTLFHSLLTIFSPKIIIENRNKIRNNFFKKSEFISNRNQSSQKSNTFKLGKSEYRFRSKAVKSNIQLAIKYPIETAEFNQLLISRKNNIKSINIKLIQNNINNYNIFFEVFS